MQKLTEVFGTYDAQSVEPIRSAPKPTTSPKRTQGLHTSHAPRAHTLESLLRRVARSLR
jgi:hypothetical protein